MQMQNDDNETRIVKPEVTEEERHDLNNAKNVKAASEVAIASGNPYAMAAGAAIKGADKLTDGKASEAIGKTITTVNKHSIGGRRIQKNLDKLAESGASDTIGTAASIKNGSSPAQRATTAGKAVPASATTSGVLTESVNSVDKNTELDAQGYLTFDDKKKAKVIMLLALIFGGVFIFVLIVSIITIVTEGDYDGYGEREYYEKACKQVLLRPTDKETGEKYDLLLDIDDYISWVMTFDTPATYSDEVIKAVSISARTHIISVGRKHGISYATCYYDAEIENQEYDPELIPEKISRNVNETRGMIITVDEETVGGYYEEACVYTASQARRVNPNRSFDDTNYYIKYGGSELSGDFFQPVSIQYAQQVNGTLTSYVSQAKSGRPCAGNKGAGISKDGAEYFVKYMNKTWDDILDYYYNGQSIIMTIYTGSDYAGEVYRQGDPAWGSIKLGNSGTNMANSGCAVTALAIGITYSNTPIALDNFDAGTFVKELNNGNCFTETGGIKWGCSTISKVAPAVKYVNTVNLSGSNSNKISSLNSYPSGRYFILAHFTNSKYARGHYVSFQELNGSNKYVARDPATGTLTTQDISEIDHIVVYSY